MKLLSAIAVATALAAACAPALAAEPLQDCTDLGAQHSVRRAGDGAVAIRDGEQYYRAQTRQGCSDLSYSGKLSISTDDQNARLCPQGSKLTTERDYCSITRVEKIDAQAYKRYTRR